MAAPRVLLAHPDLLVRDVLRMSCHHRGVVVSGEADDADSVRARVETGDVDVVVLADRLDGEPVEAMVEELVDSGTKVVVFSYDPSPRQLTALLARGASGYLMHDASPDEVAVATLAVNRGAAALHPTAAATVLSQWRRLRAKPMARRRLGVHALTPRELEVLQALADGLSNKGIARQLSMATKTVENHKIRIFDKLGVRTQAQAVTVAIGYGITGSTDADPVP